MSDDIRMCENCEREVKREDMLYTRDCHGITFRLVCYDCYNKLMAKGYDGEYYTENDENFDYDYWVKVWLITRLLYSYYI